ncbi:MAG: Gfo/Idh/MocA family oxidoreductase [Clostridia bacterium]|nr:Gfo/Idh/MocA family oxidoreductase [Clostridia bacterium]
MSKQITVAVFGCGKMGNTIISDIENLPEVKAIYGYDVEQAQLDATIAAHEKVTKVTTCLDEILEDKDVELVYIATANEFHAPLAIKALRAGKAVMTEKPSGINEEQVQELIDVQKETGGFLQVGFECRYSKAYIIAKEIIDSGEIGKLKNIHFTYSMPPYPEHIKLADGTVVKNWRVSEETVGSMYLEKLCHYIDLVRWWNNGSRVDRFIATGADNVIPYFQIEDNVHISYHFDNGCTSQLYFVMTAAPGHNNDLLGGDDLFDQDKQGHKLNYVITGTEGAIEIDIFQRQIRVYHHPGKAGQVGESIKKVFSWDSYADGAGDGEKTYFHSTYAQNRDIVKRVIAGEQPAIALEDAQESIRLCLEFTEAAKTSKWKVIER